MSNLNYYRGLAKEHWEEFLPKRWKELQAAGELEAMLDRATELTDREMSSALEAGMPRDQAWEEIRGRYLVLEPEPEEEDPDDPNPNQAFYDLAKDIHKAIMDIYDDLAGVPSVDRAGAPRTSDSPTGVTSESELTHEIPVVRQDPYDRTERPLVDQKRLTVPTLERPDPFLEQELHKFRQAERQPGLPSHAPIDDLAARLSGPGRYRYDHLVRGLGRERTRLGDRAYLTAFWIHDFEYDGLTDWVRLGESFDDLEEAKRHAANGVAALRREREKHPYLTWFEEPGRESQFLPKVATHTRIRLLYEVQLTLTAGPYYRVYFCARVLGPFEGAIVDDPLIDVLEPTKGELWSYLIDAGDSLTDKGDAGISGQSRRPST